MGAHAEIAQWDTPNDHKLPMIDAKKLAHGKGASTVMASPKSLVTLDKHRKKNLTSSISPKMPSDEQ